MAAPNLGQVGDRRFQFSKERTPWFLIRNSKCQRPKPRTSHTEMATIHRSKTFRHARQESFKKPFLDETNPQKLTREVSIPGRGYLTMKLTAFVSRGFVA